MTKKRINVGFGTYPKLSLANARRMAVDPRAARNTLNEAKRAETGHTFENMSTAWFEFKQDSATWAYSEEI